MATYLQLFSLRFSVNQAGFDDPDARLRLLDIDNAVSDREFELMWAQLVETLGG